MTFYHFLIRHFKKSKKSCFLKSEQEGQHPVTGQRAANFRLLANQ